MKNFPFFPLGIVLIIIGFIMVGVFAKMYMEKETKKQVKTFLLLGFGLFAVIAGVIAFSMA
jgi:uncharacterized membrane protein